MKTALKIQPRRLARLAACTVALLAAASPALAQRARAMGATPATTLERIRQNGKITFGYIADERPFAFRSSSGNPDGYSVALCRRVSQAVKTELGLTNLNEDWVAVAVADRFTAVQQGRVDLLCGADTETMARRGLVAFSIPVFPGGIGALLRKDAPARLREVLSGQRSTSPNWRASAGQLLQAQTFSVVKGTTAQTWLAGKLTEFQLTASVNDATDFAAGVRAVTDRSANVFFADRAILLAAVAGGNPDGHRLMVLDRYFTYETNALVMARGDEAFRTVVDRALGRLYASPDFRALYREWFGEPSADVLTFFRWNTIPD